MTEFFDLCYPTSNTVLPGPQVAVLGWSGNPDARYLALILDTAGLSIMGTELDSRQLKDPHWRSFHFDLSRYVDSREIFELFILEVKDNGTRQVAHATSLVLLPKALHTKQTDFKGNSQMQPVLSSIDITFPDSKTNHDNGFFQPRGTFSSPNTKAATATLTGTGKTIQSDPVSTRTGSFTVIFVDVHELYTDPANIDYYTLTVTGNVVGSDSVDTLDIHSRH